MEDGMEEMESASAIHQLSHDQVYGREQMYHSISRGVSYKPMLKKIGTRKMLVLPNQHTLTHGNISMIYIEFDLILLYFKVLHQKYEEVKIYFNLSQKCAIFTFILHET